MDIIVSGKSHRTLFLNTLAFTVCFSAWMFNGVMVTFLVDKGVFDWGPVEMGWLIGIPILTGSIFRLPIGMLTDKYGGKWVFGLLLLFCAIPMYLLGYATGFWSFALLSFGYGLAGTSFAVGIAYTSLWYPKKWQGTALGIFGAGNAGAAITTLCAPAILASLTRHGQAIEQWRTLPKIYAAALVIMGIVFLAFSINKKPERQEKNMRQMLMPLKSSRVWRFGLDYFLVFGCFVAFSQWLVPYFVNVYTVSLVTAGFLASIFSLPSGLIRVVGGIISDKKGARKVMHFVLLTSTVISAMLIIPKMEIQSPGKGIMSMKSGTITFSSDTLIRVEQKEYHLHRMEKSVNDFEKDNSIIPFKEVWHTPIVKVGEMVKMKQLIAKGTTRINFQANLWIYVMLVLIIGVAWGIGKAGVYKFIPDYFPNDVGVVGGMVGVIGGLGGFLCPIIFGYLLEWTGLWTSCWMFILLLSITCVVWKNRVVRGMIKKQEAQITEDI